MFVIQSCWPFRSSVRIFYLVSFSNPNRSESRRHLIDACVCVTLARGYWLANEFTPTLLPIGSSGVVVSAATARSVGATATAASRRQRPASAARRARALGRTARGARRNGSTAQWPRASAQEPRQSRNVVAADRIGSSRRLSAAAHGSIRRLRERARSSALTCVLLLSAHAPPLQRANKLEHNFCATAASAAVRIYPRLYLCELLRSTTTTTKS